MKYGLKHLLLSFLFSVPFIGLTSGIAHAACPPAPVGSAQDRVIQMVAGGDGMVRMGSDAEVDATEEGAIVYDAANNTIAICDGTNWIQLGRNGGGGPVLIGNGSNCGAGDEGAVRYTSGDPPFQYCDGGGNWLPFRQPRCQDDGAGECFLDANRANDDPQFVAANICSGANILGVSGTAVCTPPDTTPDAFRASGD